MRLVGYGYEGRMQPPGAGEPRAQGQRVETIRSSITEWYVNRPTGLEQGFTLAKRPDGGAPGRRLRIELEVRGATPTLSGDGEAILLGVPGTTSRLRYTGLKSWDSGGAELVSSLGIAGGKIILEVDDTQAVYPVTVDPTFTDDAKLNASDAEAGDAFGRSVAISGTTVVIGSSADDDAGGNSGSAYVFERPIGGWSGNLTETAKLTASDAASGARFGAAIAVSGDKIVVGANRDSDTSSGAGAAYVFVAPTGGWSGNLTENAKLIASDATSSNGSSDLAVTLDDGLLVTAPGDLIPYALEVTNNGPDNALGVRVTDVFPAQVQSCAWTCLGFAGGSCTPAGVGDIDQLVELPISGSVTFAVNCRVAADAAGTLSNTASATVADGIFDPDLSNNSAIDADTLVRPVLRLPDPVPVAEGDVVTVAVQLQAAGLNLGGVGFSIDFDEACLVLDDIVSAVPPEFSATVFVDLLDTDGEIATAVADVSPPVAALPNGLLIEVVFVSTCVPSPQASAIAPLVFSVDPIASFSDPSGQDVAGETRNGAVEIHPGPRGDCNGSGNVTVADIVGSGLEIVDGDGEQWFDAPGGSFLGSPVGILVELEVGNVHAGSEAIVVSFGEAPSVSFSDAEGRGVVGTTVTIVDGVIQLFHDGFESGGLDRWTVVDP